MDKATTVDATETPVKRGVDPSDIQMCWQLLFRAIDRGDRMRAQVYGRTLARHLGRAA